MGFVETDRYEAWQKERQAVAALPPFVSEPQKRGLRVELDLAHEADIKPEAGRVGQIHLGRMTVPDLRGISWAEVLQSMQEMGAKAGVSGLRPHQDKLLPIEMDSDLPTWNPPLPEPGEYEIGIWSIAGPPIRGGMVDRLADARVFRPEEAAKELGVSGFKGSSSLFLLMHAAMKVVLLEGKRFTLGEPGDRLVDKGKEYMPYYAFQREVNDCRAVIPLLWHLRFGKVNYDYYADHKAFGFRPVTK